MNRSRAFCLGAATGAGGSIAVLALNVNSPAWLLEVIFAPGIFAGQVYFWYGPAWFSLEHDRLVAYALGITVNGVAYGLLALCIAASTRYLLGRGRQDEPPPN